MIPPHTSCRYALLADYSIAAVHSIDPEGDEMLVSDVLGGDPLRFMPARLVNRDDVLYLHANHKAAVATRTQLRTQDAEAER